MVLADRVGRAGSGQGPRKSDTCRSDNDRFDALERQTITRMRFQVIAFGSHFHIGVKRPLRIRIAAADCAGDGGAVVNEGTNGHQLRQLFGPA